MTDGTKNAIMVSFGLNARIRMLLKKRNKGPVIRASFLFNLSPRNIVAVQVENLGCAYYHVCDLLVWQQNSVVSLRNFTRIIGQWCVIKDGSFFHII